MADISAITSGVTGLTALADLIPSTAAVLVRPQGYQPQPKPPLNYPPAIMFHYEGEQDITLESDITDHYVENNTSVEDQIALKPEIISTHGFIGELNNVPPNRALAAAKAISEKLTVLGGFTPGLSVTALRAYNQALFLYSIAANAVNAGVAAVSTLAGLSNDSTQTQQQKYFQLFQGYWRNRTLFTVQTPWAQYQNCAIRSLRAVQDEETKMITDFHVTFKVIRFATTTYFSSGSLNPDNMQGRAAVQGAPLVDIGTQTPPESELDFGDEVSAVEE